jgi:putative hydrolase of the HAD superfamily
MERVEGIVFDMDDTLYLEQDYVRSGFQAVARFLALRSGLDQGSLYEYMARVFAHGDRRTVFNQVLRTWPELESYTSVHELVQVYRNHEPGIQPLLGIPELLERSRVQQGLHIGLISDGYLAAQKAKFKALGLSELIEPGIFTDIWGRDFWKPHTKAFELISKTWRIPHDRLVYIGDNPAKDFIAPTRLGWRTIRLRVRGQLHEHEEVTGSNGVVDHECRSVRELEEVIKAWTMTQ